jgi:exopolysaccharide biosynthesis polyprenyl glycosylphosphotransferase
VALTTVAPAVPTHLAVAEVQKRNSFWLDRYAAGLVVVDLVGLTAVGLLSVVWRFGGGATIRGLSYFFVAGALVLAWMLVLAMSRCYETRFLGAGPEEFRRVANASIRVTAAVALVAFAFQLPLARSFLALFLPLGTVVLLLDRRAARAMLRRGRLRGRYLHRTVLMGSRPHIYALAEQLACDPLSGLTVVGACLPRGGRGDLILKDGRTIPVLGSLTDVNEALVAVQADTVAVAASPGITADALRGLSYQLEGTGVDLLVAPALTNVTGTRVSIRPMAGLPLLHLEEPELAGVRKLLKTAFDVVVALVLLVLLLPVMLAVGVAVRLTTSGPALFRQERVGRAGAPFTLLKFRSMYDDAERRLAELTHLNEHDGVLFKLRNDPRVTPLGKFLRKYSLDELPQLVNVVRGQMSLVGPRPPLPSEVARYDGHAHRRLLVKPGITGLWQVSGRSDLSWEETVRLDLQYVENWSLGLDISVLAKTTIAVFRSRGAY